MIADLNSYADNISRRIDSCATTSLDTRTVRISSSSGDFIRWRTSTDVCFIICRISNPANCRIPSLPFWREKGRSFGSRTGLASTLAASHWLRKERPETKGSRIGAVGFCMGGMLSALLASRDSSLNAAVIFYGSPIQKEQLSSIECPVLGHYGGLDSAITDKVPEFEAAMKELGKTIEVHVYPETPHAFFNDDRPSYRIKAAREAFARTISFFAKHLV